MNGTKRLAAILCLLSGAVVLLNTLNVLRQRVASVNCSPVMHDIGAVKHGTIVTREFKIRNDTSATVRLLNVLSQCGCTKVRVAEPSLRPGGTTTATLVWNTNGFTDRQGVSAEILFGDESVKNTWVCRIAVEGNVQQSAN